MKAYLLGILPDSEAAQLEQEYFADPARLRQLQNREVELISEYLDGSLNTSELSLFEARYCKVPLLKQQVERVRREREMSHGRNRRLAWATLAAAAACSVAVVGLWLSSAPAREELTAQIEPAVAVQPFVTLSLSPGLLRSGAQEASVSVPPGGALRLSLEIPGARDPIEYNARVLRVGSGEAPIPVWTSSVPVASHASATGGTMDLLLDASVIAPDDYIAELLSLDGAVAERYVFRVTRASGP